MLNVTIKFSPAWRTLVRMKQGKNSPLAGSGLLAARSALSAAELGSTNGVPMIASAQKIMRRCDRKRF